MTQMPRDDNEELPQSSLQDEPAGATESPDEPRTAASAGVADEVLKLQAERDSLYDRLARATAEFKNAQKRMEADADQRVQYANSSLIKSLLPVIDNFERALAVEPEKADARTILKGMQIVHDQWLAVLKQQKVEELAPEPGAHFDPNQHQAIRVEPDSPHPAGTVSQLYQKGYALHGRTLRPATVAVSKSTQA